MTNSKIRNEYLNSVTLFNIMNAYSSHPENLDITCMFIRTIKELQGESILLPSGRNGLPIALAIEMQLYDVASYLLSSLPYEDIQNVIIAYDDKKEYTLKEVYEYSSIDFNDNLVLGNLELDRTYQRKVKGNLTLKKILN